MYRELTVLHLEGSPTGLVMVFRNGLLQEPQKPMNPGSGDYFLENNRIHFQPFSCSKVGDLITAVYEAKGVWSRDSAVIK